MPEAKKPSASAPPDPHVSLRADRPVEVRFSFEQSQSRLGVTASVLSHIAMAVIVFLVMNYVPERAPDVVEEDSLPAEMIFLPEPGPGGGGGGGGNKMPDPPKKAELPGKEKITVPVEKKPEPVPKEEPPAEELEIPAKPIAAAEQVLPGAIAREAPPTESQGAGTLGGAGTGAGKGIGPGQGSGLGPGTGGNFGGGARQPGSGVSTPVPLKEVKPAYTADAMRAKVQGTVWLECIVMPDGTVGDVRVTKSLDSVFGLDQEAVKAARQWRFRPGMLKGEPVAVIVTIELTFTLR